MVNHNGHESHENEVKKSQNYAVNIQAKLTHFKYLQIFINPES